MFSDVYSGQRVLVTGHTGFKGSWLCAWLLQLGARVAGFAMGLPTQPANFQVLGLKDRVTHFLGDIRDRDSLRQVMDRYQPEVVFHLAAQSLVRRSYAEPAETLETNALGTMNLLECLRQQPSVAAAVIITSDKCYRNREWTWGYRENDVLGGEDPYSASKACAELISQTYAVSFFGEGRPRIATARAGNVIGGGDWASDRIIPDSVRAWSQDQAVKIRHPQATRPWQHVLEPLSGYLWLGARLLDDQTLAGESFNFGPSALVYQSVADLLDAMRQHWPGATWEPDPAGFGQQRESTLLKLCCDKALNLLQWRALLPFAETIRLTAEWYRSYYEDGPEAIFDLSCWQIAGYQDLAVRERLPWAIS